MRTRTLLLLSWLQDVLEDGKRRKYVEKRINHIIWEVVRYGIFMYLVSLLAFIQRDDNVFRLNNYVIGHGLAEDDIDVSQPPDVYDYLADLIDDGLYDPVVTRFFDEESAYFLIPPRLRQYRRQPLSFCVSPTQYVRCIDKFSSHLEDRLSYSRGWRGYNTHDRFADWEYRYEENYPSHNSKSDEHTMPCGLHVFAF